MTLAYPLAYPSGYPLPFPLDGSDFNPASLFAGGVLGYFYDWQNESYTDTGLTTKAVSGDSVAGFKDISGNANHVTQGSAGKRAPLGQNAGFLALEPDGIDDSYQSSVVHDFTGFSTATIFSAFELWYTSPAGVFLESSINTNANVNAFALAVNDTVTWAGDSGIVTRNSANTSYDYIPRGTPTNTVPRKIIMTFSMDVTKPTTQARIKIRVNGVPFNYTPVIISGNMTDFGNYVHYFMARNNSSAFTKTRHAALGFVGKLCNDAEISATERWMAAKCGVML